MNPLRVTVWLVGGGLVAVWIASTAGGARPGPVSDLSRRAPAAASGQARLLEVETARLGTRRVEAGRQRTFNRDLFRFERSQPDRAREAAPRVVEALSASAAGTFVPPPPAEWQLVGVAESRDGTGRVRTAVIRSATELLLVKEGAQVGGRYEVVRIQPESVELRRLTDGTSVTLALGVR
jgi:hypothetical protein